MAIPAMPPGASELGAFHRCDFISTGIVPRSKPSATCVDTLREGLICADQRNLRPLLEFSNSVQMFHKTCSGFPGDLADCHFGGGLLRAACSPPVWGVINQLAPMCSKEHVNPVAAQRSVDGSLPPRCDFGVITMSGKERSGNLQRSCTFDTLPALQHDFVGRSTIPCVIAESAITNRW